MNYLEYQEKAFKTCTPACYTDKYLNLGYVSEVGELAGKLAKWVRGDVVSDADIMQEIGDCAWMAAVYERLHGSALSNEMSYPCTIYDEEHGILELLDATHDDAFYAVKRFCEWLGFDFDECLKMNIEKLASRQQRGVINGNGDDR